MRSRPSAARTTPAPVSSKSAPTQRGSLGALHLLPQQRVAHPPHPAQPRKSYPTQHKMRQVVEWITALLTLLRQQPAPCPQSISSLNFEALQPNHQRYFVFVEDYHRFFYQLKVLDENGQILSFKIEENS
jgi:hypothetical protein